MKFLPLKEHVSIISKLSFIFYAEALKYRMKMKVLPFLMENALEFFWNINKNIYLCGSTDDLCV